MGGWDVSCSVSAHLIVWTCLRDVCNSLAALSLCPPNCPIQCSVHVWLCVCMCGCVFVCVYKINIICVWVSECERGFVSIIDIMYMHVYNILYMYVLGCMNEENLLFLYDIMHVNILRELYKAHSCISRHPWAFLNVQFCSISGNGSCPSGE